MDESVKSDSRLDVSVSFGRFENDALSWEKWSSFSPNKYMEEVGSLSTPGSVAQKKAYFEAHYKKIAARKAEQLELENSKDLISPGQEEPTVEAHLENSYRNYEKFGTCNAENSAAKESCKTALTNDTMVDETRDDDVVEQEVFTNGLMDGTTWEEEKGDATAVESRNSMVQEPKRDINILVVEPELHANEAVMVGEQIPRKDPQKFVEQPPENENRDEQFTELKQEISKFRNIKLNSPDVARKITPSEVERNLTGRKKKVVSPIIKPSQASAPKSSFNFTHSGKKKVNRSPLPKSTDLVVKSKRSAPTALHMSLSLGPGNSSAAFSMARKSLIMEKMGDKDIVKRAFKSFQNQINGYPADEKSSTLKQVSSKTIKTKFSPSLTPRKENKGLTKVAEKSATQMNILGDQLKPLSSGSHKSYGLDRRNATAISPSIGLKSYDRAEKRKEFRRNLEARSLAREAENIQLSAKSKEEKESEIRKLRQTLNFKARPLPSFYNGQGKGLLEKAIAGSKTTHHQHGLSNT